VKFMPAGQAFYILVQSNSLNWRERSVELQSCSRLLAHHQFYLTRQLDHSQIRIHRTARPIMPRSARNKSKGASKRPAPSPEPTNAKKPAEKAVKRVKPAQFIDPATLVQEPKERTPETEDDGNPLSFILKENHGTRVI
jgi:hypothetical protein